MKDSWAMAETKPVNVRRSSKRPNPLRILLSARRNLLEAWPEEAYGAKAFDFRLLNQHYFVCNSPDTVRRVFLEEHENYDRKSPAMRRALEPLLGDGLFVSDGEKWRQRRQQCAPAFEPELMPAFTKVMVEAACSLADQWQQKSPEQPIYMLEEMAKLTAGIIGRTVFGDETSEEESRQVVRGFSVYQRYIDQANLADTLGIPQLAWMGNPWRRRRAIAASAKVQAVIDGIIARHRQQPTSHQFSLLSLFLDVAQNDSEPSGCPMDGEAARNEALVMFMAGHETTANSLAWCWYLLDHSPRVSKRLQDELDQVLDGHPPTLEDVPRLHYTRAVFEEALRLYPPVPLLTRQARHSDQIRNHKIEPGSVVMVVPWLLHRHRQYWQQPDHFIPERFMPGQPRPDRYVYIPFSAGARVCLGLRFGLTEGILCLATLAQRFEARLQPGHKISIECRLTLRPRGGLPMLLAHRPARPGSHSSRQSQSC